MKGRRPISAAAATAASSRLPEIPAIILAGGEGRRMGGTVKALLDLHGQPLIDHVRTCVAPQASALAVCVRPDSTWPADIGLPILHDRHENAGPLAGVYAALAWARDRGARHALTVPADCPFLPSDLITKLGAALAEDAEIAVAASGGRRHHLIALWPTAAIAGLDEALHTAHAPAVHAWQKKFTVTDVEWPCQPHDPFFNINTDEDLTHARQVTAAS